MQNISKRRLKSLEHAEEVCKAVRYLAATDNRFVMSEVGMQHLFRWMRNAKKDKYDMPKKLKRKI